MMFACADSLRRRLHAGAPRVGVPRRSLLLLLPTAAAAVLPLLALGASVVWADRESVRHALEGRLLDAARTLAEEVDGEFGRGEAALLALSSSPALRRGDFDAFEGEMRAVARGTGAHIALAAADGLQALNTTWRPGERRGHVPAPAFARDVFATGRARVSDLYSSPSDGQPAAALAVPVPVPATDAAAERPAAGPPPPVSHALGFIVPRERFRAMIAEAAVLRDPGGAWGAAVFDRTGRLVAGDGADGADGAAEGGHARPDTLRLLERRGDGVEPGRAGRGGEPVVSAFAHAPRTGFGVVVSAPADAFHAPLRGVLWRGAGFAAALLAGGAALAVLWSRRAAAAIDRVPRGAPGEGGGRSAAAGTAGPRAAAGDPAAALARALDERDRAAAELRALFDVSPVGMAKVDTGGRVREANAAFLRIVGMEGARVPAGGLRWGETTAPEHAARDEAAIAEAARRGRCEPFQKECVLPDGRRVPVLAAFALLDRERGEGAAFVVDLSEQKRTEAALAASGARLARALSAARMATWEWDCETDALRGSQGLEALYGREPGSLPTGTAELAAVHPDDRARRAEAYRLRGRGAAAFDERFRALWPDGAERWLHAMGRVTERGAGGDPLRASGVVMDVTPLREEQARRDLLVREVDHRAKNVLSVAQAVLKLTVAEDPKEFGRIVEGRIAALARAHTLLARDQWAGADVRALLDEELAPFLAGTGGGGGARRRVALDGPAAVLSPWAVQPFAMALHELATNAAKYGALSGNGGGLTVSWRLERGTGDLEVRWEEKGAPRAARGAPTRRGFGTRVIDSTVRDQLGGLVAREWNASGLLCTLRLPASRLAAPTDGAAARHRPAPIPAGRPSPRPSPGGEAVLAGRRVLVVEDEAVLAQALVASLAALGAEAVGPAASLEDALRLAATAPALDAAVLDLNLAGQDSVPVADVLAGRGVPTVFATGYASLPSGGVSERHGAVRVLRKPLAQADLADALRGAVAERAAAAARNRPRAEAALPG